jgi:uncharacterized protein YggE
MAKNHHCFTPGNGRKMTSMSRSLVFVAVLMVFEILAFPVRASDERKVSVSGECNRLVVPDRGAIVLTAEVIDQDLKDATRKAMDEYERTRTALKKLNLEDLDMQTAEYNVERLREYEKGKTVNKGFRVRMGLRVSISSVKRMGEVIAIGAREGLQDVGRLTMYLSNEKASTERSECLKEAAENAKAKAEKLASALGAKVGAVISISDVSQVQPPMAPMENMAMLKADGMGAAPTVEAGKQNISITINAVFGLK